MYTKIRFIFFVSHRYVSRVNYLDSSKHTVLGTQQFRPKEFANQIALGMDNAWGILRCIIDTCMKLPEGKYLILKDPTKVGRILAVALYFKILKWYKRFKRF